MISEYGPGQFEVNLAHQDHPVRAADQGDALLGEAVAGLQATMAESMAIFAPNINVYRRFKPDEFVPVTRDWGENNAEPKQAEFDAFVAETFSREFDWYI